MRKPQSGRSMVEMLGVLAVVGVLSVGGLFAFSLAMRGYKANKFSQEIEMLAINVISHFSLTGYEDLTTDIVIKLGLVESSINMFNGAVTVNLATETGRNDIFAIRHTGIPKNLCPKILSNPWGNTSETEDQGKHFYAVRTECPSGAADKYYEFPLHPSKIETACCLSETGEQLAKMEWFYH